MTDDGWIEWKGGQCSVPSRAKIDIKFRDGSIELNQNAHHWQWSRFGDEGDIIAYRVIEEPRP